MNRQDSLNTAALINHLRQNFDDIHDVSMRFHHKDHNLNGLIILHLQWSSGQLDTAWVTGNETGDPDFARALISNISKWQIPEITGLFEINLPLMIRIVGKTDSTFDQKSILTGKISDTDGNPVWRAQLQFVSLDNPTDSLSLCLTNREGIFVKTLIPTGRWQIKIHHKDFKEYPDQKLTFKQGEHIRINIKLKKI